MIRPNLKKKYHSLCNISTPITTQLFGDDIARDVKNIGITHVFSCINICRVPRMLFEHEADRPSVQTSSEGPGKC